jgi:hypothetical protein
MNIFKILANVLFLSAFIFSMSALSRDWDDQCQQALEQTNQAKVATVQIRTAVFKATNFCRTSASGFLSSVNSAQKLTDEADANCKKYCLSRKAQVQCDTTQILIAKILQITSNCLQ